MSYLQRLTYGLLLGALFLAGALFIGFVEGKLISTVSLIGTSVVLEAQPAAVASLPLRFHPLSGALISILGNLIPIPVLMSTFDEIISRWSFLKRKLHKAETWSKRYGKYGVWILIPFSPIFGAYVCIGIGYLMRWKPRFVLASVLAGVVLSSFAITYGGESVVHLVRPYL
ncbi:small multi-drug export protein [Alicyclobacillus tolerans]|uniref:small multi-drug export protein n=1 Tax=Alicyclobacillus tolerans TaxID=90970 RepID=UPI001F4378F9|nr:small multi-drug export protein [Alicyclobacillus tolerans]MCF8564258.1 small multi-drug export protein [Alicyclobacillus tolerans]